MVPLLRSCFDLMAQLLVGDRALLFWPRDHVLLETAGERTPLCRVIPSEISGMLVCALEVHHILNRDSWAYCGTVWPLGLVSGCLNHPPPPRVVGILVLGPLAVLCGRA